MHGPQKLICALAHLLIQCLLSRCSKMNPFNSMCLCEQTSDRETEIIICRLTICIRGHLEKVQTINGGLSGIPPISEDLAL